MELFNIDLSPASAAVMVFFIDDVILKWRTSKLVYNQVGHGILVRSGINRKNLIHNIYF